MNHGSLAVFQLIQCQCNIKESSAENVSMIFMLEYDVTGMFESLKSGKCAVQIVRCR